MARQEESGARRALKRGIQSSLEGREGFLEKVWTVQNHLFPVSVTYFLSPEYSPSLFLPSIKARGNGASSFNCCINPKTRHGYVYSTDEGLEAQRDDVTGPT